MRAAKAAGKIRKIPSGRIPGRRKWEPIEISRARVAVKEAIEALLAVTQPFAEKDTKLKPENSQIRKTT